MFRITSRCYKSLERSNSATLYSTKRYISKEQQSNVEIFHRAGLINMVLPLPNSEKCYFPLYPTKTVNDLITDIREEDRPDSQIVLTDKQGNRISHTISISQLIKKPFVILVDNNSFTVDPLHLSVVSENILSSQELQEITMHAYYQKIRSILAMEQRHHMEYQEYLQWCNSFGLTEKQAFTLSKALHKAGIILHFHQNADLKSVIFLKPEIITDALADTLHINFLTRYAPDLRKQLDKLLVVYEPLNVKKEELDRRAAKRAKWWMKGALGYLAIQFSILARMVWFDFNWDIMEPITYFVGIFTLLGGYSFFVLYGEDYTYQALENRQKLLALKKFYIAEDFNWRKWHDLHQQVKLLQEMCGELPKRSTIDIK